MSFCVLYLSICVFYLLHRIAGEICRTILEPWYQSQPGLYLYWLSIAYGVCSSPCTLCDLGEPEPWCLFPVVPVVPVSVHIYLSYL